MRGRVFASILLIAALVACTDAGPELARIPSPSPTAISEIGLELNDDCHFDRRTRGEISFVREGKLYLMDRGDDSARCVFEVGEAKDIEWGPAADRVHVGDLRRFGLKEPTGLPQEAESISWSRPTGTSLVYIFEGRLMKIDAFGRDAQDVSFLADHDEVVYHPSGTHVAVAGTGNDGTYGLWLATNFGEEPQLLAIGEDAKYLYSLAFSHDGRTIFYVAQHDDHYDVHSVELALKDDEGRSRATSGLTTIHSSPEEIGDVIVSEFGPEVVSSVGSCEEGRSIFAGHADEPMDVGGLSVEPIGWLPDGTLVILTWTAGCDGPGDLYLFTNTMMTLIARGVDAAGVRGNLPPPPGPPGSEQEVIA